MKCRSFSELAFPMVFPHLCRRLPERVSQHLDHVEWSWFISKIWNSRNGQLFCFIHNLQHLFHIGLWTKIPLAIPRFPPTWRWAMGPLKPPSRNKALIVLTQGQRVGGPSGREIQQMLRPQWPVQLLNDVAGWGWGGDGPLKKCLKDTSCSGVCWLMFKIVPKLDKMCAQSKISQPKMFQIQHMISLGSSSWLLDAGPKRRTP